MRRLTQVDKPALRSVGRCRAHALHRPDAAESVGKPPPRPGTMNGPNPYQLRAVAPSIALVAPLDAGRTPCRPDPWEQTVAVQLNDDEQQARRARLQAGAEPDLVRLLQLRHLLLDHLDPRRLLHDVRSGLEQRWADCHLHRLAAHLRVHPDHRVLHERARVGLPDLGRHLLVGQQARRRQGRLLHRLAQPDRAPRHRRLGRLRRRDVLRPVVQHDERVVGRGLQPHSASSGSSSSSSCSPR